LYDGNSWKSFTQQNGLFSNAVTCIKEDKEGKIWVATDNGLNVYSGGKFVDTGLAGKSILTIVFDRDQNLWVGCWRASVSGGGLFRYDGKRWESYTTKVGLPGLEILKVFEDSHGNIWVGTYEQGRGAGVGCYDGRQWKSYTRKNGLINDCVYSMFQDPDGNMWFGTVGGISLFDGKSWYRITTMDGLVDDRVYSMLIDSKKKMWFGTEGGVSRFDGKNWISFTREEGLVENLVRAIIEDNDGKIWFGTYPYEKGKGGISVARYTQESKSLSERVIKYLPSNLTQKFLDPGESLQEV
jgi:ligand-binding sensor domain-containing protein